MLWSYIFVGPSCSVSHVQYTNTWVWLENMVPSKSISFLCFSWIQFQRDFMYPLISCDQTLWSIFLSFFSPVLSGKLLWTEVGAASYQNGALFGYAFGVYIWPQDEVDLIVWKILVNLNVISPTDLDPHQNAAGWSFNFLKKKQKPKTHISKTRILQFHKFFHWTILLNYEGMSFQIVFLIAWESKKPPQVATSDWPWVTSDAK